MPESNQTEQATPRRRQKAREKGQVSRSRDLIGAASAIAATIVLVSSMPSFPALWRGLLRDCLDGAVSGNLRMETMSPFTGHARLFVATGAALGLGWIAALGAAVAQGGLVFAPASLLPTLSRISPAARLRQLFSIGALRSLLKSLLPAGAVVYIGVGCLRRDWTSLLVLSARNARGVASFTGGRVFEMAWKSALVLLLWSFLDYVFERRRLENDLKMSRQELRDEYKETEGNPIIKSRIRRLQRAARRRRMLEDTKRAAVVVTNPTSYAIALELPPGHGGADCDRQGAELAGLPNQGNRALEQHTHRRKQTAGAPAIPHRRNWRQRSTETLCGRRRSAGGGLPGAGASPQRPRSFVRGTPLMPAAPAIPSARHRYSEWIVPIAAVSLVFVMLVPLPAFVLDLLLAMSIAASVLVLLSALQILRPAQFSVFPSLLLLLTLFRLSLNLASSRRILLHGNEGASAAGRVIEAFGQFVVGGNYVVGFVLFLALIAIQYIVVSHGAVRTAEVTARFTLDALPGKQMAIDADLNAGLIDEAQARARREQVAREAEFYGAMDGAARFNQRDSIATILITGINILAGFLIGVFQLDIPFREALRPTPYSRWAMAWSR